MRRIWLPVVLGGGVLLAFLGTLGFLVAQSTEDPLIYETITPAVADIVLKTVATGAIVPRTEVEIKSRVSGVVDALHVEPGERVEAGALIAEIRIIPDSATLNSAQSTSRTARIERDNAQQELSRAQELARQSAISSVELQRTRTTYDLAAQSYNAAVSHLQIVKEGATRGTGNISTQVRTTVAGMVLAVDVKSGQSVTETNTFSDGTTVALVADMGDLVFEGTVDESEVGKLGEGMALDLTVGALQNTSFSGTLEYISPKGLLVDGAVQFEIRAALTPPEGVFVRAGSSATADIVLDRRDGVLALDERALQFEGEAVFVEVEVSDQTFERRDIEVGLSDGLQIEVLGGLEAETRVKAGEQRG